MTCPLSVVTVIGLDPFLESPPLPPARSPFLVPEMRGELGLQRGLQNLPGQGGQQAALPGQGDPALGRLRDQLLRDLVYIRAQHNRFRSALIHGLHDVMLLPPRAAPAASRRATYTKIPTDPPT
ncbi:hypothetical protein ACFOYW_02260 [Gryllotalpicola reticulitermitis]|uniref:Uncharacterized protein n=1 Tax=Gryllotalpicola reticulitermitis TaxID=1184153 RepID=A0ABV8Q4X6_9MICO